MARQQSIFFLVVLLAACGAPSSGDGGLDGAVDAGSDGGGPDASLPPLELTFLPVNLPTVAVRLGLVSDGTTLYALSTIGSVAQGTLQPVVVASTDEGLTFPVRAISSVNALIPAPDGGLYGVDSQRVLRSDDGAQSFAPLMLPASVPASPPPFVTVTPDATLWVTSRANPPTLVRSVDQGATFDELTVPASSTRLEPCSAQAPRFVALRNGSDVVAADGGSLESLGSLTGVTGPGACHVTAAGAVLATVGVSGGYESWRLPAGVTTWESAQAAGFFRFVGGDGRVFRWLTTGRVDESTDDGATWTPRVGATPEGTVLAELAVVGTTLVGLTPGGVVRHEQGASAWEVRPATGVPAPLDVADLAFAADTSAAAMLVNDNIQRTVYLAEDGVTWRRGVTLPQGAATSLALHPDGTQVFLGAIDGSYRVFADAGTALVISDRIETIAGARDTNPIRQAVWGRAQGTFIFVTTANDADTAGSVWQLNPDVGSRVWEERRPFQTTTAPAVRLGGYHALAVSIDAPPPALTRSLLVSLRSTVSTNSFLNYLLTRQPVFGGNFWWLQDAPPVGFTGPLSASVNGAWGDGVAVLWPENQLWVGRLPSLLRQVPVPAGLGTLRVARFGKDGRLWLAGSQGLWRTTMPVVLE